MEQYEPWSSGGYRSGSAQLSSPETSSHTFGNVYATGNAVIHLGDSIHSQLSGLTDGGPSPSGFEARQRKAELQSGSTCPRRSSIIDTVRYQECHPLRVDGRSKSAFEVRIRV